MMAKCQVLAQLLGMNMTRRDKVMKKGQTDVDPESGLGSLGSLMEKP